MHLILSDRSDVPLILEILLGQMDAVYRKTDLLIVLSSGMLEGLGWDL